MNVSNQTRDLSYGYPAIEQGFRFASSTNISYLEILRYQATPDGKDEFQIEEGHLDSSEAVKGWVEKDPEKERINVNSVTHEHERGTSTKKFIGGLRLLYGACAWEEPHRIIPLERDAFKVIEEKLGVPEQFVNTMPLRMLSAFEFSCPQIDSVAQDGKPTRVEFKPEFCRVLKFSIFRPSYYYLSISHSPTTSLTYIILLSKLSSAQDHSFPKLITSLRANPRLSIQPFYLPLLISSLCNLSSEARLSDANTQLNELEETMGQHEWSNRPRGDPLEMDFMKVGRRLNFIARMLGVERMRVAGLLLLLNEINRWLSYGQGDTITREERKVKELVRYEEGFGRSLGARFEYQEKRVQSQLAVVYQFMAQKDAKVNIELAATSATIAKETKKDGSSMKTIAILTMFFLPGTFLAALFAMPLFNWDDEELPIINSRLKYYWAIAIPLTIFVLVVWALALFLPWRRWTLGKWRTKDNELEGFKEA